VIGLGQNSNCFSGRWLATPPLYFFKQDTATKKKSAPEGKSSAVLDHGKAVRCAYCKTVITYQGNAESMAGKHVHHFTNPGGFEFTIGCYRKAWCRIVGVPTLEWSWFNGHSWQYALCNQCQEHLGWFFQNTQDKTSFYGLILDRLIIEDGSNT